MELTLAMGMVLVSGSFTKIQLDTSYTAEGIAAGDFNRDGHLDIVAGAWWYEGPAFQKRQQIFPAEPFNPRGYSTTTQPCFIHDFNRDGWPDVFYVVRTATGWDGWWYENPAGKDAPWPVHRVLRCSINESPTWADLNRDGRPELLTHSPAPGYFTYDPPQPDAAWVFTALSSGQAIPPHDRSVKFGTRHGMGCGDINGDGRPDVITSAGWWEQPASPGSWKFHPHPFAAAGAQMFVADLDGDGLNDVITVWDCHRYGLVWQRQLRDGVWELHEILPREPLGDGLQISQMHALAVADLNGDGLPDLVTGKRWWAHGPTGDVDADRPAVLYWFELQRGGRFVPHLIDDDSGVGTQVMVVDVNGDGRPDILTSNKKGTQVFLQLREGEPRLGRSLPLPES